MFRRSMALAATALIAVELTGCATSGSWTEDKAAAGWSAQYGDAANSSYSTVAGATDLKAVWTRSAKGDLAAQVAMGSGSYLAVNAQTDAGCSLMLWEADNGARQRWCTRTVQGGGLAGPLMDGFDNVYVGQPGMMMSFPLTQWIRWRKPVIGVPMTPRFLADGRLLVVTHLGQVLAFDAHRGTVQGTPIDLVKGVDPTDSVRGLADCRPARARCPVAAAPAYSPASKIVVLSVWQPNTPAPVLVGLRYRTEGNPILTPAWTSDAVGRGPLASPVLSADGETVYVNGRDERLWALDADNGKPKWSVPLDFLPQTPPSVSPDGLLIAGGGPEAKLVAVADRGDHGDVVWSRDDVTPLSTTSRAGLGYTVVAAKGENDAPGQALLVFDTADGRTVNNYPLPEATGWPVGVSIGHDGRVVAATSDGQVYGFAPG